MKRSNSVKAVTKSGTQLEQLKTLAMTLAEKLDDDMVDASHIASLARQYRETINQIAAIEADDDEGDEIDEIIKRRNADR